MTPRITPRVADKKAVESNAGFTILEIMIATAILTLGLVGILALFPVAIYTGKQIVEKSTSVVAAESVAEAIRQGLRNNLRFRTSNQVTFAYFIFKHDGVMDEIPNRQELEKPDKDYYVLLPRFPAGKAGTYLNRDQAQAVAKTFVYPETDPNPNGNGDPFQADDDGDDYVLDLPGGEKQKEIRVEKTYSFGNFLPSTDATGESVLDDQKIESLKQYSYAFSIQNSRYDANLSPNENVFQPANRLYRVRVMVYRGFTPPLPDAKPPDPVFELYFEVAS
jgi:type II secretory pathway pseudopilin PulG